MSMDDARALIDPLKTDHDATYADGPTADVKAHQQAHDKTNEALQSVPDAVDAAISNATSRPFTPRGVWDAETVYEANDTVTHADTRWIAKPDVQVGDEPGVAPTWLEFLFDAIDTVARGKLDGTAINAADPRFGGLVYDGNLTTRAGTDNADTIRAAVGFAKANGYFAVYIPGRGALSVTKTLPMPSQVRIYSDGPGSLQIVCPTPGIPVFASESWATEFDAAPTGRPRLEGMRILPEANDPNSHGVILRDYMGGISDVTVQFAGGDGVRVTATSEDGTLADGSLVEHHFSHLTLDRCKGYGFNQDTTSGTQVTDAHLNDVIVRGDDSLGGIRIPYAAGWKLRGFHTYSSFTGPAVIFANMWNGSVIYDGHIESQWTDIGLQITNMQQGGIVDLITVQVGTEGGTAIAAGKHSLYPGAALAIGTVQVVNRSGVSSGTAVTWSTTSAELRIGQLIVSGPDSENIALRGGWGAESIHIMSEVTRGLALSGGGLALNGYPANVSSRTKFSGGGEKSVTVGLPFIPDYEHRPMLLSVFGRVSYNGGVGPRFVGQLVVTQKLAGTNPMVADLTPLTSSGFDVDPTATISDDGAGNGTLTVTFTQTSTNTINGVVAVSALAF